MAQNTNNLIAGVDVSQPMINQARLYCEGLKNTLFTHMLNGFEIPAESGCFDFVYSHIVLQHIHKYKVYAILKEFFRVTRPGAKLCIQLPDLFESAHEYETYVSDYVKYNDMQISAMNFWTEAEIRFVLEMLKFRVLEVEKKHGDMFVLFEKP